MSTTILPQTPPLSTTTPPSTPNSSVTIPPVENPTTNPNSNTTTTTAKEKKHVPLGAVPELLQGELLLMHANAWPQKKSCRCGTLFLTNYRIYWSDALPLSYFTSGDVLPEEPPNDEKDQKEETPKESSNSASGSNGTPPTNPPTANTTNNPTMSSWSSAGQQQPGPISIPYSSIDKVVWNSHQGHRVLRITTKHFMLLKLSFLAEDGIPERIDSVIRHFSFCGTAEHVFAFTFHPKPISEGLAKGWRLYSPRTEFARMGIPDSTWRISEVNSQYSVCESYPSLIAVPFGFTDEQIKEEAAFRTSGRLPALCWRDNETKAVIVRSSQPKVGIRNQRSDADVTLIEQIRVSGGKSKSLLSIFDARPKANAVVNKAMKGAGSEDVAQYNRTTLHFMNIENIHVMRESKRKMRKLIFNTRLGKTSLYPELETTGWLHHIQQLLTAATRIAASVASGISCLIHCSDGWDRTPQLTALAQLLLDPFYRTIDGFGVLVEKEWLSFGHKFTHRCGIGRAEYSECSPIFMQFLDCIWQISLQFPCSFEFNEEFLIDIADELYFCRVGTFLGNTERERLEQHLQERTISLWTLLNSNNRSHYINQVYSPNSDRGAIHPKSDSRYVRLWKNYYNRFGTVIVDQIGWGAKLSANETYNQLMDTIQRETTRIQMQQAEKRFRAVVMNDYEAKDDTQLTLHIGEEVFVIEEANNEFWLVSLDSKRDTVGYFPKANLKRLINPKLTKPEGWISASRPPKSSRNQASVQLSDSSHHRTLTTQRSYLGNLLNRLGQTTKAQPSISTSKTNSTTSLPSSNQTQTVSTPRRKHSPRQPPPTAPVSRREDRVAANGGVNSSNVSEGKVRRRSVSDALMPDEYIAAMARELLSGSDKKAADDTVNPKKQQQQLKLSSSSSSSSLVRNGTTWKEAKLLWGKKPLHPKLRKKHVRQRAWSSRGWSRKGVSHAAFRRQTDPGYSDGKTPPVVNAILTVFGGNNQDQQQSIVNSMPSKPSRSAPIPQQRQQQQQQQQSQRQQTIAAIRKSNSLEELPPVVRQNQQQNQQSPPFSPTLPTIPLSPSLVNEVPNTALPHSQVISLDLTDSLQPPPSANTKPPTNDSNQQNQPQKSIQQKVTAPSSPITTPTTPPTTTHSKPTNNANTKPVNKPTPTKPLIRSITNPTLIQQPQQNSKPTLPPSLPSQSQAQKQQQQTTQKTPSPRVSTPNQNVTTTTTTSPSQRTELPSSSPSIRVGVSSLTKKFESASQTSSNNNSPAAPIIPTHRPCKSTSSSVVVVVAPPQKQANISPNAAQKQSQL